MTAEPSGGFACPICGKDSPHTHSADEARQHHDLELWVERSWVEFQAMNKAVLAGEIKLPLSCGCDDDPECPFCGHPNSQESTHDQ